MKTIHLCTRGSGHTVAVVGTVLLGLWNTRAEAVAWLGAHGWGWALA
jgi:hypothetical protein